MNAVTGRAAVAVIAIIALATVVGLAVFHRDSGFSIKLGDGDRTVSLDFGDKKVVEEVLDEMLAADDANASDRELVETMLANRGYYHLDKVLAADNANSSNREMVETMLATRGYYHITDDRLVSELTNLPDGEESGDLRNALRNLLYELKGPFAEPNPFAGVRNTLLVDKLMELDPRRTSADGGDQTGKDESQPVNPLMSELWRRSIEIQDIFRPHEIRATIRQGGGIPPGTAVACTDSLLDGKQITITSVGMQKRVMVDAREFCSRPAPNAQELLAGEREQLYLAPDDFVEVTGIVPAAVGGTARRDSHEVAVVVAPKHFVSLPPGAAP